MNCFKIESLLLRIETTESCDITEDNLMPPSKCLEDLKTSLLSS